MDKIYREGRVNGKNRGYKIGLLIVFFIFCIIPYGSASKSNLEYEKSEVFFDYACTYFNLEDFDQIGAFSPNTLALYSKKEIIGIIFNGKWEFLVTKDKQKTVIDEIIPYNINVCDDKGLNCTQVIEYNYTYKNIVIQRDEWLEYDEYLPFYNSGYKTEKIQKVRYCSKLKRVHTEEGFKVSVDIIPKWDDKVYLEFAWWNNSLGYSREITNLNNYVDPFLVADGHLTLCNATSNCWNYYIWCNSSATKIYYNNNTGSTQADLDIYCTQGDLRAVPMEIVGEVFNHGQANPWTRHTLVLHCDNSSFYDSSPDGNTPAINSAPFVYNAAPVNKACGFDGTDDRISYGDVTESENMTIFYWFRRGASDYGYPLGAGTAGNPRWWMEYDTKINAKFYDTSGDDMIASGSGGLPAVGKWWFNTVTILPDNGYVYISGVQNATDSDAGFSMPNTGHNFYIGDIRTDLASNVSLDEVWIMNVTLNQTVINFTYLNQIEYGFSVLGSEVASGTDVDAPDINFVSPTPNSSTINYTYIYINATTSESANCSLDWNGTNQSVSNTTNSTFYVNKTSLSNGNYTYSMWCTDNSRNLNQSETRYIYINYTTSSSTITLDIEKQYCYDSNYLYIISKDVSDNGTAEFNSYLRYCEFGCYNVTVKNLGNPGCRESDFEIIIYLIIFVVFIAILLRVTTPGVKRK